MIEFRPENFYIGMWFIEIPPVLTEFGKGGNTMGCIWGPKDKPQEWVFQFRHRYYRDERVFDHNDTAKWYRQVVKGPTLEEMEKFGHAFFAKVQETIGNPVHFFDIHGDGDKAMEQLDSNRTFWMQHQTIIRA